MGKTIYPWELHSRILNKLPSEIKGAMQETGWNHFGIYELVKEEIAKWKREQKKTLNSE